MFADLDRIQCPTLVLGGEDDPIHPIESQADIAAALPPHLVRSSGLQIAGTPSSPTHPSAPWP
jgi:pimeloyl-ACP methyl ester carboxylesterase